MFTYIILNSQESFSQSTAIIEDEVEISPAVEYKTLILDVEYTFDDDIKKVITVSIFQPNGDEDIQRSLMNRGITEERKLNQ